MAWLAPTAALTGFAFAVTGLAAVAVGPLQSSSAPVDVVPSASTPPVTAAPEPAVSASPTLSPGGETIYAAPGVGIVPPPPARPKAGSSGKYTTTPGGQVVDVCSMAAFSTTVVSSAPYASSEAANAALLNQLRSDLGLAGLAWSDTLASKARAWAVFLAQNDCVIYHGTNFDNGENIFWRSGGSLSELAALAHAGFVASPGHYANLIRDWFTRVGIGIAKSPTGKWYLVQNFGA